MKIMSRTSNFNLGSQTELCSQSVGCQTSVQTTATLLQVLQTQSAAGLVDCNKPPTVQPAVHRGGVCNCTALQGFAGPFNLGLSRNWMRQDFWWVCRYS